MRGMFTAGVIDVFMENGVEFTAAIGVSAGAAFGCNLKSRQIGRVIRYNTKYCRDKRYCSVWSLLKTGDIFGADFCYRELPEELDPFDKEEFERNPLKFCVVCTDALTGEPVYKWLDKADSECYDWMRASASMPMVSRPVTICGQTLLDGGMSDSIPLLYMQRQGYERNVVILTQPRAYVKEPANRLMLRVGLRKYPAMVRVMEERHNMYRCERDYVFECEKRGDTLVICPDVPLGLSHTESDPEKLRYAYNEGRRIAQYELDDIKSFISND